MSKKKSPDFWDIAPEYLNHHLKEIRQCSLNTVESYRNSLNIFINYLENEEHVKRNKISFDNFDKETLKKYQEWLIKERKVSPKTCNLRMTAIRSLLEYASNEYVWLTSLYLNACNIVNVKLENKPIEYFEPSQIEALLRAPSEKRKSDIRNKMILIFMYDTAARVNEIITLTLSSLHLDSEVPYVTLMGKGRKYRNIPLSDKTIEHLKIYLLKFHNQENDPNDPLFYSMIHGKKSKLSDDTFQKMIKRYSDICEDTEICMPENVHCHMIRKTRAMDLYRVGVPLTHIQQLLGHENMNTTSGFYAFVTLDVLAKSLEKVNTSDEEKIWENPDIMEKLYKL